MPCYKHKKADLVIHVWAQMHCYVSHPSARPDAWLLDYEARPTLPSQAECQGGSSGQGQHPMVIMSWKSTFMVPRLCAGAISARYSGTTCAGQRAGSGCALARG